MQPASSNRIQQVQGTLAAFSANLNRYGFTKKYITGSYSLSEMKEALDINNGVIQSSFSPQMAETLSTLRDR